MKQVRRKTQGGVWELVTAYTDPTAPLVIAKVDGEYAILHKVSGGAVCRRSKLAPLRAFLPKLLALDVAWEESFETLGQRADLAAKVRSVVGETLYSD